jgi:hypothetical protein
MKKKAKAPDQKIIQDGRGQLQPADKERAQQTSQSLPGDDNQPGDLKNSAYASKHELPEGLKRPRRGPIDKRTGRTRH